MNPDYEPFDLRRMFIGDFSPLLMLEIGVRTVIMFLFALLIVRLLGKRGIGQITPFEYVLVIAMGSATGDPMFTPELPLLHGMIVLTVVVAMHRLLVEALKRFEPVERAIDSTPSLLIEAGVINHTALEKEQLTRDELLMWLREYGVRNTGEVEYAFLEPSGKVSVFTAPELIRPGQSTLAPENLKRYA